MENIESKFYFAKLDDWKIIRKHIKFEKNNQIKGISFGWFEENIKLSQKGKCYYGWKVEVCFCWREEKEVPKSYSKF